MTDIVARLREPINPDDPNLWKVDKDRQEAADEIERLRDDSRMLALCEGDRRWMADEIERLKRELECANEPLWPRQR